jgi:hypothetical protein
MGAARPRSVQHSILRNRRELTYLGSQFSTVREPHDSGHSSFSSSVPDWWNACTPSGRLRRARASCSNRASLSPTLNRLAIQLVRACRENGRVRAGKASKRREAC